MSSVTRASFRVRKSGTQSMNLDSILGAGGRHMLQETLESICDNKLKDSVEPGAMKHLGWTRSKDERSARYDLSVPFGRASGLTNANLGVSLEFRQGLARVTHKIEGTSANKTLDPSAEREAIRMTNQAVNQVLAVAVAQKLQQRCEQRMVLRNTEKVRLTISQNNVVRIRADVQA